MAGGQEGTHVVQTRALPGGDHHDVRVRSQARAHGGLVAHQPLGRGAVRLREQRGDAHASLARQHRRAGQTLRGDGPVRERLRHHDEVHVGSKHLALPARTPVPTRKFARTRQDTLDDGLVMPLRQTEHHPVAQAGAHVHALHERDGMLGAHRRHHQRVAAVQAHDAAQRLPLLQLADVRHVREVGELRLEGSLELGGDKLLGRRPKLLVRLPAGTAAATLTRRASARSAPAART